ncbi:MAG: hypothetical protein WBD10_13460 [Acidobacteriaceae bacterium]
MMGLSDSPDAIRGGCGASGSADNFAGAGLFIEEELRYGGVSSAGLHFMATKRRLIAVAAIAAAVACLATAGVVMWRAHRALRQASAAVSAGESFAVPRYSNRCGGRTVSLRQLGIATGGYPYFSVVCDWCRRHPLPASSATNQPHGKAGERAGGPGRTVGLCQHGAAGMAAAGAKFDAILRHDYPETELRELSSRKR